MTSPKTPKKLSSWWAIAAVLVLVGAAMWYETQYRAMSKPTDVAPVHQGETQKPPDSQQQPKPAPPSHPSDTGVLTG